MQYNEVLARLQKLINYTPAQAELCQILDVKQSAMSNRANRNSEISVEEIKKINDYYSINLFTNTLQYNITDKTPSNSIVINDRFEIPYWPNLPDKFKNPKIRSVWFDREVIENKWFVNPEKLFIIPMLGDALSTYWYRINDGDLLIIDTEHNEVIEPAIYFATSRNNTMYWIREIDILANDVIEFHRYTQGGKIVKTYNREELKELDFKVIGQVIKNISFRI